MEKINKIVDDILNKVTNDSALEIEASNGNKLLSLSETGDYYYYGKVFEKDSVIIFDNGEKIGVLKRIPKNEIRDSLIQEILQQKKS